MSRQCMVLENVPTSFNKPEGVRLQEEKLGPVPGDERPEQGQRAYSNNPDSHISPRWHDHALLIRSTCSSILLPEAVYRNYCKVTKVVSRLTGAPGGQVPRR